MSCYNNYFADQFMVQQHDVKVTHQMQNASFPINQSHLPQVGGNPFF